MHTLGSLLRRLRALATTAAYALSAVSAIQANVPPSPENQVFQWAASATSEPYSDGTTRTAKAYLWIPESCVRVRGVLVLATNVPEHRLVGHAALRAACERNGLALVWSVPTFWNFAKAVKTEDAVHVRTIETLLTQLAEKSGYDELATAPWLPMGESGHLLMVVGMADQRPERTIGAICIKNPHNPKNRTVPMLWTFGSAQEWGQTAKDPREAWRDLGGSYANWTKQRSESAWPLSILIEPGTGHFHCTDAMAEYFAAYINELCERRLPVESGAPLRAFSEADGVLADLPIPGVVPRPTVPTTQAAEADRRRAWFPSEALATKAQAFAAVDYSRETQIPAFVAGPGCEVKAFSFNSVSEVTVTSDGVFALSANLLASIPEGFVGAGAPLATTSDPVDIEWLCGPIAPAGPGRFRIALDRTWKTGAACYVAAIAQGNERVRPSVQPAMVKLVENKTGSAQRVSFDELPDLPAGTREIQLVASSDAGLPVSFYVESGPATIDGRILKLRQLPPRAKLPAEVTVVAWQWGRASQPQVRGAEPVRRTFRITAAKP